MSEETAPRPHRTFGSTILLGLASVGGAAVVVALLQIFTTAVIARHVEPSEWGGAAFAISSLGLALAVGQFGLAQAIVQVAEINKAHFSAASLSAWLWSGGCAMVFVLIGPLLGKLSGIPHLQSYLYVLAPCILIRALSGIAEGAILRQGRFSQVSAVDVGSYAVGYVGVGMALAVWGGGGWALVCAYVAATVTRLVGLVYVDGLDVWERPGASTFRDILPFAGGQTLAQSANYVATESDNFIVGATFGPAALGTYGRAYSIAVAPANSLSAAIDKVFYPSLVGLRRTEVSLCPSYLAATELALGLALPAAILMVVAAPEIVLVLLGSNWMGVVMPLRILSLGLLFRALFQMSDCFCRAVGAVYASGVRQGVYAASVIVGSLVGSIWGPAGVAAGVVLAMAVKYALMAQLSLAALQVPARSYLTSIFQGAKIGSMVTLGVLATVQVCRHAQSPALVTCATAGLVLAVITAFRIYSATDQRLAARS